MKEIVLALFVLLLGVGCGFKADKHAEGPIPFSYYESNEKPQPKNHLLVLLAPMHITFSKNVPANMQQGFKDSMLDQIQMILEKRGFSVAVAHTPLSATEQDQGYVLVEVSGDVKVLEDISLREDRLRNGGLEGKNSNLSMGFLELKILEPKSQKALDQASLELPGYQVRTRVTVRQERTSSGGYMPVSVVTPIHGSGFDSNVYQILSQIYAQGVEKISRKLRSDDLMRYNYLVQKFKKSH
ncbi:HpaA family protein [Helicobacter suis]|uniref:HpaA family protein n=1 Tax=Helicobacter suis TaxID=104628 RepID=UPI0013D48C8E|nr:HpaA family protein [Helicobacter suis]